MIDKKLAAQTALLNHALRGMGYAPLPTPSGGEFLLDAYRALLGSGQQANGLEFILSTLAPGAPRRGRLLEPRPLALTRGTLLGGPVEGEPTPASFQQDWARLGDPIERFEVAAEVIRKHAWAVPCTYGEPGVSLYEEFKLLAALVAASGYEEQPADSFTLVAGDFPGIQDFIYTITSKGAAKGLRGRSFFLQLLGDAVVRALLAHLGLPWLNVVYVAGGNFLLLAPAGVAEAVRERGKSINEKLLDHFRGDIALCLACETLAANQLTGEGFKRQLESLKDQLGAAKLRAFVDVAGSNWEAVFSPRGGSDGTHCAVCYREPESEPEMRAAKSNQGQDWRCPDCQAFDELAGDLARKHAYLSIGVVHTPSSGGWQELLADLSGYRYELHDTLPPRAANTLVYRLNDTNFPIDKCDGFRLIATRTPLARQEDVKLWQKQRASDPSIADEDRPRVGETIRTFEYLAHASEGIRRVGMREKRASPEGEGKRAHASEGIRRVGILRMDVDNLGKIFGTYIQPLSLARLSAASAGMSLFFDGWLNVICDQVEKGTAPAYPPEEQGEEEAATTSPSSPRPDTLYLIYAGGDDLFIVGSWDVLPGLAQRIHDDLTVYVGHNPHITISAGITLEDEHFPLYRAAERAKKALDEQAKTVWYGTQFNSHGKRVKHEKNAVCFLGQVVGWDGGWKLVLQQRDAMLRLLEKGLPRSLVQVIQQIHALYEEGRRSAQCRPDQLYFGRWAWMQAYSLTRLAKQADPHGSKGTAKGIKTIQTALLTPGTVHLSGLAARWAEYLTRRTEGDE